MVGNASLTDHPPTILLFMDSLNKDFDELYELLIEASNGLYDIAVPLMTKEMILNVSSTVEMVETAPNDVQKTSNGGDPGTFNDQMQQIFQKQQEQKGKDSQQQQPISNQQYQEQNVRAQSKSPSALNNSTMNKDDKAGGKSKILRPKNQSRGQQQHQVAGMSPGTKRSTLNISKNNNNNNNKKWAADLSSPSPSPPPLLAAPNPHPTSQPNNSIISNNNPQQEHQLVIQKQYKITTLKTPLQQQQPNNEADFNGENGNVASDNQQQGQQVQQAQPEGETNYLDIGVMDRLGDEMRKELGLDNNNNNNDPSQI